jgi:ABC-type glycerol-3-phosphate transport system substrate-binding protein
LFKNGKGTEGAKQLLNSFIDPTWYAEYINKGLKGRFVPVFKNMGQDPLWKQDLYSEYQTIIDTARSMAYSAAPLGAIAELTSTFVIADLVQDVVVKKVKPADALATFVKTASEIYAKPENKR